MQTNTQLFIYFHINILSNSKALKNEEIMLIQEVVTQDINSTLCCNILP